VHRIDSSMTELAIKTLLVVAACAAALLGLLWLAFACRELWHAHLAARSRRDAERSNSRAANSAV